MAASNLLQEYKMKDKTVAATTIPELHDGKCQHLDVRISRLRWNKRFELT